MEGFSDRRYNASVLKKTWIPSDTEKIRVKYIRKRYIGKEAE